MKTIHVAAGIIRRGQDVLAVQRGYGEMAGLWEFPGGKAERGETAAEACARELREELQVEVEDLRDFYTVEYDYPEFHLEMECFFCELAEGGAAEDAAQECEPPAFTPNDRQLDIRWVPRAQLMDLVWMPADVELASTLAASAGEASANPNAVGADVDAGVIGAGAGAGSSAGGSNVSAGSKASTEVAGSSDVDGASAASDAIAGAAGDANATSASAAITAGASSTSATSTNAAANVSAVGTTTADTADANTAATTRAAADTATDSVTGTAAAASTTAASTAVDSAIADEALIKRRRDSRKSMQGNKRANTKPELLVRQKLREAGLPGYRLQWKKAPGRPDIAYPGRKVAIFVNGCFWHRCPHCQPRVPKRNRAFWEAKFARNVERDARALAELEEMGWTAIVIWECELKRACIDETMERVVEQVRAAKKSR